MSESPAQILASAIEAHRDQKYGGGLVTDKLDLELYNVAVWFRTWEDHTLDPDAPIVDV